MSSMIVDRCCETCVFFLWRVRIQNSDVNDKNSYTIINNCQWYITIATVTVRWRVKDIVVPRDTDIWSTNVPLQYVTARGYFFFLFYFSLSVMWENVNNRMNTFISDNTVYIRKKSQRRQM